MTRGITLDNPNLDLDLADMSRPALIMLIMDLLKRNAELEDFQEGAFMVDSNIDIAIEYMRETKCS